MFDIPLPIYSFTKEHPLKTLNKRTHIPNTCCKKNCTDQLYHKLNNYHPNINLTIESNPRKFLDKQVITKNEKNRN